jgi:uncharacterized protein involved in exopolysaccharide biosynthesis
MFKALPSFIRPFVRGLPFIILVTVAGLVLSSRMLRYSTPMYESMAKIKLAQANQGVPNSNLYKDFDLFAITHKIESEVELIKSHVLIEKAIEPLGIDRTIYRVGEMAKAELYDNCPFHVHTNIVNEKWKNKPFAIVITDSCITITAPDMSYARGQWNSVMNIGDNSFLFTKNEQLIREFPTIRINDTYELIVHTKESVIAKIAADLDVMAVDKDVPVLRISIRSAVPEKSANIVNAVCEAFIDDYLEYKYKTADTTVNFLDRELQHYTEKMYTSESEIENYKNAKGIINIRQETETDLREISDMKKQLSNLQMSLLAIDSLNNYIAQGADKFLMLAPNFEAFTDLLSTEVIKKIKALQSEKHDLLLKYTPDNEKVAVIDKKIKDLTDYLTESIRNTETNLRIKYSDLQQTIAHAESKFIGLPTREKDMAALEREFGLDEQIYRFLHEKRTEAELAKAAKIAFHRVITPAEVSRTAVSPAKTLVNAMAGFVSMLIAIILVYARVGILGKIEDEEEVIRASNSPVLVSIPYIKNSRDKDVFKRGLLHMELRQELENCGVICISSNTLGEGKSFVARELNHAATNYGWKTLLLTATSRGIKIPNSDLMPFDKMELKRRIAEWKKEYQLIIIDNLSLQGNSDALMLMSAAEVNLFVLDNEHSKKKWIAEIDLMKEDLNLNVFYYVMNNLADHKDFVRRTKMFMVNLYYHIKTIRRDIQFSR